MFTLSAGSSTAARLALATAFGSAVMVTAAFRTSGSDPVPYPDGYRQWVHVKSALVGGGGPGHGLHHIYANDKALRGYPVGRFPNGSVIVFDVFEVATTGNVTAEVSRRHIDVMHKDSSRFAESGGWGFEEFRGGGRDPALDAPTRMACLQCHTAKKDRDFVYSSFRP